MGGSVRERLASLTMEQRTLLLQRLASADRPRQDGNLYFSLFFFGNRRPSVGGLYDLIFECARVADERGFRALWTPERHFHEFGAAYPEPAILAAAVAVRTQRLQVRAGSVVLPINDTARVVERWCMVDNISGGRAGIAFAAGWHPTDFVLARKPHEQRHDALAQQLAQFELMWRGSPTSIEDSGGSAHSIRIHPTPVQPRLPIWITCSRSPEPWRLAARLGYNVLTGLMEQSVDELGESIRLYRSELQAYGHDPAAGQIALMMHTYVAAVGEDAREVAKAALREYLGAHMSFYETTVASRDLGIAPESITPEDRQVLIDRGISRYLNFSSLVGTLDECAVRVRQLRALGVDEIAALVDFGLADELVLKGVDRLAELVALTTEI